MKRQLTATEIKYTGDPNRLHIRDGKRGEVGLLLAIHADRLMRANYMGDLTPEQVQGLALCPGCFMIAGFNMLLKLADDNGLPRKELADFMQNAFQQLAENPDMGLTEEIELLLDPCET
jgi:hypothetical protein